MNAVFRSKQQGQSIPLIALMMVLLFAMVGLSVDVGNTYAEQRTSVRASNAAAIAAMDAVIKGYDDTGVAQIIRESLKANGLNLDGTDNSRRVLAYYMDVQGRGIANCQVGLCTNVPSNVNYIQVSVDGKVNTYFARVVGQDKLPVNATAYAGRCAPTNGVYPIAVSNNDIDANGFTQPNVPPSQLGQVYGMYKDDNYPAGKPWRRLSLKRNDSLDGNFSWLRWSQANWTNANLATGLSGEGNLAAGFQEADWPTGTDPKPSGYPLGPGGLSVGDLVYGNPATDWVSGDGVHTAVKTLMANRTLVLLPIIDKVYGSGTDSKFKVTRLGKFYIINPTGSSSGGISPSSNPGYLDLVYLGTANESACLVTNVDPVKTGTPSTDAIEVRIPFQVKPRWRGTDNPGLPVAYQLVVDVSGSMSFDFKGNGTLNGSVGVGRDTTGGTNVHCEWASPDTTYPYNDTCQGGPNSPWWKNADRRVSITKAAIRDFVNALGPNDTMRYTAFSTRGDFPGNTQVIPSNGYTNNKATLLGALDGLGSYNNDPNRTQGGTPGPQALNKAKSIILSAPTTAPNGQAYRRVVVYLTDGVANVFINGTQNQARDKCGNLSVNAAVNTPFCQTGYSDAAGMWRPISAMIEEAKGIKQADPTVQIYVVALAGVATDGLKDVASSPSMLYSANNPGIVDDILRTIREQASGSTCLRQGGTDWKANIADANWGEFSVAPYNVPRGVYGKATIYNENGTAVVTSADITNDPVSTLMGIRAQLPLAPTKWKPGLVTRGRMCQRQSRGSTVRCRVTRRQPRNGFRSRSPRIHH